MKKFAVILSGCGFKDGSEITEAISTFIALTEVGAKYEVFAPDIQITAANHLTGVAEEKRSVLAESARISRARIARLSDVNPEQFDGLIFPGGFGASNILCTFATEGAKGRVLPDILKLIESFHSESKPICGICIAPAMLAMALGSHGITVTIGSDKETASEVKKTGAQHENCAVDDFISDRENKIVTTPAYMYDDATSYEVFKGVRLAIRELVEMA